MKTLYIVANWKSYKTTEESALWLEQTLSFQNEYAKILHKKVILCPPFTLLAQVKSFILKYNLPFLIGAQTVSSFPVGAYTGEINAQQLTDFAEYALVGHSERRRYFQETDNELAEKVQAISTAGIIPIYCVQDKTPQVPASVAIVGYEPISAIGTGQPDTPDNAESIAQVIKKRDTQVAAVLYGGSVTPENVFSFTSLPSIDGVIIGGASLDAEKFYNLVKNA